MATPKKQDLIIPELPPLGWLFQFNPKSGGSVICGSSVEIGDKGFREGCWATRSGEDPNQIASLFGSGMEVKDGRWLFLNASHTFEALFLFRHSKEWSVSNSLSFLVAHHRLQLPWDARYGAKFASICHGIDYYEKTLFRTAEGEVLRLAYDNIEMESNGNFRLVRKPMPPEFRSFKIYTDYLRETLKLAFEDAARRGYRPMATCSSGYDSACATALGGQLGCREAVTLKNARGGDIDSGKAIGEALGLRVHEFERLETVETFEDAAEFLVCGMGGEDYCYRNFAPVLRKTVLLTGFHGGNSWDITRCSDPRFGRADLSGGSLQEFRLWNDFIHIPVPTIGTRRHPEVVALSSAAEMMSYRLHNSYDKPIPRRIIEETGVPRRLFGQQKKTASILLFFEPQLFAPSARREYEAAVPKQWVRASKFGAARISWELRYFGYRTLRAIEGIRGGSRVPGLRWLKNKLIHPWCIFEHSHPRAVLEFLAALNLMARRYRRALDQHKSFTENEKSSG